MHIAGPIAALPLKWERTAGTEDIDNERAVFWDTPAVRTIDGYGSSDIGIAELVQLSVMWLALKGEYFWILDDSWLGRSVRKSPIIIARPDRMREIIVNGQLIGWQYLDHAGNAHNLLPEQVIHERLPNPCNPWRGMGPLEAALVAVNADYAAGVFTRNLSQNNGDRGVYISSEGTLNADQQKQVENALREKKQLGLKGIVKTTFLAGSIKVHEPAVQSVDTSFIDMRKMSQVEIYVAFGVPPSMTQVMASYSVGAASDRYRLREETCIPYSAMIATAIAKVEKRRTGERLKVCFDWAQDGVMAEARNERIRAGVEMWKTGIPWDTISKAMSLALPEFEGSAIGWLPMSMTPVNASIDPPDTAEDDAEDPEQMAYDGAAERIKAILDARKSKALPPTKSAATCHCCEGIEGDITKAQPNDDARTKLWRQHMALQAESIAIVKSRFSRLLMEVRKETLANLAENKAAGEVVTRAWIDIIFDPAGFTAKLITAFKALYGDIFGRAAAQLSGELEFQSPWEVEDYRVIEYAKRRENRLRGVADVVYDEIKKEIQEGIAGGESNQKIANRLRAKFNEIDRVRSKMVAQTEVTAAYGEARQLGLEENGFEWKEWLSARDGRARTTHLEADEQTVKIDVPFIVGGATLRFPGDPSGPADEVINCRCVLVASEGPDEE
jgi:hypothetical protein